MHKSETFDNNYLGSGHKLIPDIQKFGSHNFHCSIVEWCGCQRELKAREFFWINYYKQKKVDMYNIAPGGGGGDTTVNWSQERRKQFSELQHNLTMRGVTPLLKYCSKPGKLNGMYGKKHTEESKERNRQKHLGIKLSQETRQKMKLSHDPNNKPPTRAGLKRIYKDTSKQWVKISEVPHFLEQGWELNSRLMHKDDKTIRVSISYAKHYANEGWKNGTIYRSTIKTT